MNNNTSFPCENLSVRIRRALDDMTEIRQYLMGDVEALPGQQEQQQAALDLELAADLKTAVDALRQLLWAYIQALSVKSGRPPQQVMDWYKMELAVEMLRSARSRMPAKSASEETWSFEDLVNQTMALTSTHAEKEPRC